MILASYGRRKTKDFRNEEKLLAIEIKKNKKILQRSTRVMILSLFRVYNQTNRIFMHFHCKDEFTG